MKIAAIQMDVAYGQPEVNFAHTEEKIKEAAGLGADIAVLPEMWNTGYDLTRLQETADHNGEKTKAILQRLSSQLQIAIVGGSVATKKAGGYYNSMYVANKSGEIIAEYDKAHLFRLMDEHHYLQPGNTVNVFTLDGVKMGGMICYDLRFPEWFRLYALKGAQIIFVPAQWPDARIDHWKTLLQARAIENQCFVVAVNRVGMDPNNAFNGNSMIIAPWGKVLWTGENKEMIHVEEIDLQEVRDVRERIPVFQDRRENMYDYRA
ncbi:carbon-nitrogen family hydrolase [Virgibacillus sp. 179-BFC.A HS]|uniref:Carbon-nitrogen family hydrolase n=1 Tax=Tigheibacillus jepli TaxID=3035914 RepID=A0ABU5CMM4_9BACI|nr:carbon-nitrogen family hydrolase [Virgibacillus sp. 179-BFC.A HS]MDY0407054.1 carbon-nitrogen family hydrolase [Virgibacillus sp. 179-BFC.A HS]